MKKANPLSPLFPFAGANLKIYIAFDTTTIHDVKSRAAVWAVGRDKEMDIHTHFYTNLVLTQSGKKRANDITITRCVVSSEPKWRQKLILLSPLKHFKHTKIFLTHVSRFVKLIKCK